MGADRPPGFDVIVLPPVPTCIKSLGVRMAAAASRTDFQTWIVIAISTVIVCGICAAVFWALTPS